MFRKLLVFLLCFGMVSPSWATYAYNGTAHVKASVTGGNPTGSVDMTGSDLLIAAFVTDSTTNGLSDSSSNSWVRIVLYNSNNQNYLSIWYAKNPTVTSAMTFTPTTGGANVIPINVVGVSGSDLTAPSDLTNGQGAVFQDSLAPGAITPSNDNSLIFSAYYYTRTGGATVDNSVITIDDNEVGGSILLATGYKIQTTATSINPTWTNGIAGNVYVAVSVESFKAAAGGGGAAAIQNRILSQPIFYR